MKKEDIKIKNKKNNHEIVYSIPAQIILIASNFNSIFHSRK